VSELAYQQKKKKIVQRIGVNRMRGAVYLMKNETGWLYVYV
jgi:hypothetical protein